MSLKASGEGLKLIKQARQGWSESHWCREASKIIDPQQNWETEDHIANDIFADGCSIPTLKNFIAGKSINARIFQTFCQIIGINWQEVVDLNSDSQLQRQTEKNNFIENFWVGRCSLINKLSTKLRGNCRVLVLTGITGIGKTALAYQLSKISKGEGFRRERPLNFDNDISQDFVSVAAELLICWGEVVTAGERKNIAQLTDRLLRQLQNHPYLVQIDSLESLLCGDEATGWNNFQDDLWIRFFHKLIELPDCQSRFIVTSQEFPNQFQELCSPEYHYCENLIGLELLERLELFLRTGIEIEPESSNRLLLGRIGTAYEGHPLALLLIAGEILSDDFSGNVSAYWEQYGSEIEEIEKLNTKEQIESENDKIRLYRIKRLKDEVKKKVENSFKRLTQDLPDAYVLLCAGAVYRRSVPKRAWFKGLEHLEYSENRLLVAMEALKDRYLVELESFIGEEELHRQHNLIRSIALEHNKKMKIRLWR
jgi:hypothetical protein